MRRRDLLTMAGSAAVVWPFAARAQQPRMLLIGALMGFAESDPTAQTMVVAFRGALLKLGWTEGSNVRIEFRWGGYDANRINTLAKAGRSAARRDSRSDHTRDRRPSPRDADSSDRVRDRI